MARPSRTGQSIVEYLILATVIITAILIAKPLVQGAVNNLYKAAKDKVEASATNLKNM